MLRVKVKFHYIIPFILLPIANANIPNIEFEKFLMESTVRLMLPTTDSIDEETSEKEISEKDIREKEKKAQGIIKLLKQNKTRDAYTAINETLSPIYRQATNPHDRIDLFQKTNEGAALNREKLAHYLKNEWANKLSKKQKDSLEAFKIVNHAILNRSANSRDMMFRSYLKAHGIQVSNYKAAIRFSDNHVDASNAVYEYQKEKTDKSQSKAASIFTCCYSSCDEDSPSYTPPKDLSHKEDLSGNLIPLIMNTLKQQLKSNTVVNFIGR